MPTRRRQWAARMGLGVSLLHLLRQALAHTHAVLVDIVDQIFHLRDLPPLSEDDVVRELAHPRLADVRPFAGHDSDRMVRAHSPHILGVRNRTLAPNTPERPRNTKRRKDRKRGG